MSLQTCSIAFAVLMPVMDLRGFAAALDLPDTSVLHESETAWKSAHIWRGEDFEMSLCSAVSFQVCAGASLIIGNAEIKNPVPLEF